MEPRIEMIKPQFNIEEELKRIHLIITKIMSMNKNPSSDKELDYWKAQREMIVNPVSSAAKWIVPKE